MFYSKCRRLQLLAFLCLVLSVLCTCGGGGNNATTLAASGASSGASLGAAPVITSESTTTTIPVTSGCTGASPTWTSTPDSASVASCVSRAKAGDTINVSAGSSTWEADAVTIPVDKPLKIMGPGADSLIISLNGNFAFTILPYVGTAQLTATRISGFKFLSPLDAKYSAIKVQGQGWRIDHCAYESIESASSVTGGFFIQATGINTTVQPYGLVDNNTIINGKIDTMGAANATDQSAAWYDALDLGGASAVYIEDNHFSTSYPIVTAKHLVVDSGYAGKYVFRYNTVSNGNIQNHSLQVAGNRGSRKTEVYGNSLDTINDNLWVAIHMLAGTGVVFNNNITGKGATYGLGFDNRRSYTSVGCLGLCNGSQPWDGNLDASGWPCRDQIGRGGDVSQWANCNCGIPAPSQINSPFYAWSIIGASNDLNNLQPTHIQANRDYYYTDAVNCPSNSSHATNKCSAGVGCGPPLYIPEYCATGTAYWATNQSCSDMTGMVGANPTTPISGTLYKCTATNTWTPYYTPYTYPHPLRQ
jgi:hypothetical protein